jgi:hypothetical protein
MAHPAQAAVGSVIARWRGPVRVLRGRPGTVRAVVAALGLAVLLAGLAPAQGTQAAAATRVVRYGPFTIPAGTATAPGTLHDQLRLGVARPCADCHITAFAPDLVYADGTRATMETGPMLHHAVFASLFQRDATCGGTAVGLAGERFFGSGDERTAIAFPNGYGYRVHANAYWLLLVDLMNHATTSKTVYLQVTYTYRPAADSVKQLRPVWLDIDQCGDSRYAIPAGPSDTHWDWNVNVPGRVMAMLGHVHGHGVAVEATNESRGRASICKSVATLDPADPHRVLAMSTCQADPPAVLKPGETVRLHSMYQSPHAADDVMGIMLAYIDPS